MIGTNPLSTLTAKGHTRLAVTLVVILCVLVLTLEGTDAQLLAFAAPVLLKEWGLEKVALAGALAAAFGGMILGSAIGGILGDKWGRRRVLLASIISFGVLTVITGAATDLQQMTVLRLLGGIGFGAIFPNIFALVSEFAPSHLQTRYVTVTTTGVPLGSMVGALAVGWAMPLQGWRFCFVGAGILTLACAALVAAFLPESPAYVERRGRKKAAEPISYAPNKSVGDPHVRSIRREKRLRPIAALFQRSYLRRTAGLWILAFTLGYVAYAFMHWGPTMLTMSGMSLRLAIMSTFFTSLLMAIAPFVMAWNLARFGSKTSMLMALSIYVLAIAAFGVLLHWPLGLPTATHTVAILASMSLIGFAIGATTSCLYSLSVSSYPIYCRATGSGFSTAIGRLGAVATAIGSAVILGSGNGTLGVVVVAIIGLAIAAASTVLIDSHILPSALSSLASENARFSADSAKA